LIIDLKCYNIPNGNNGEKSDLTFFILLSFCSALRQNLIYKLVHRRIQRLKNYELVVIFDPSLKEEDIEKQLSKITSLLEKEKCKVSNIDKWGSRKLAYPIKKQENGYYVIVYFNGDSNVVNELDRINKIDDKVLRHLIVKSEES
jgi:small subunit ribosomal protein S6